MTVIDNEDPADPSAHEPRVTGAPEAIWLVYGDLEHDDTHANCCASGEVTWCEDAQFAADVRYTRTDLVAERVRAAVAEERERWRLKLTAHRDRAVMSCYASLRECEAARNALQRVLDDEA